MSLVPRPFLCDAVTSLRFQLTHRITKSSLLCCTWGHKGAAALAHGISYVESRAYIPKDGFASQVVECVLPFQPSSQSLSLLTLDSPIGAGDTFIAGMLYSLLRHNDDWTLKEKLSFANELAGRKVLQEGFEGLGDAMKHRL